MCDWRRIRQWAAFVLGHAVLFVLVKAGLWDLRLYGLEDDRADGCVLDCEKALVCQYNDGEDGMG